jgi:hypothetical protein
MLPKSKWKKEINTMNEEIKTKLLEYLTKVENGVEQAANFTAEQAPLYIQDLISWGIIKNGIWAGVSFLAMIVGFILLILTWYLSRNFDRYDKVPARLIGTTLSLFLIAGSVCASVANGLQAAKCYYTPRVYVVETIQELIK